MCEALVRARETKTDAFEAVEAVVPWEAFVSTVRDQESAAQTAQLDPMRHVLRNYGNLRVYAPRLLQAFKFKAAPSAQPLVEALNLLRELYRTGKRTLPERVPLGFVRPKWAGYVFEDGGINRRYYEFCVLDELRLALRSGDVWVVGSRKYRDLDAYLLPQGRCQERMTGLRLGLPRTFDDYWEGMQARLEEQLRGVGALLGKGELADVKWHRGKLKITPLKKQVPPEAERVAILLSARMPRLKITDLLLEVDRWVNYSGAFTDVRNGKTTERRDHLLTALLAEGLNLGLTTMSETSSDGAATPRRLMYLADWDLRPETYAAALAEVVNFQARLPLSRHRGDGSTSSSDG